MVRALHAKDWGRKRNSTFRLILPDEKLSINQEGIAALGKPRQTWFFSQVRAVLKRHGCDFDTPLKSLSKEARQELLYGTGKEKIEIEYSHGGGRPVVYRHRFSGVVGMMQNYYSETASPKIREWVEGFMSTTRCSLCQWGASPERKPRD